MNSKQVIDMAANIIRRQDLDRGLLLFFVNTARRTILRDKAVKRFNEYRTDVDAVAGVIDMTALGLKTARVIEWDVDNGDGTTTKTYLARLMSYQQAMQVYGTLTPTGNPQSFLEIGTTIRILPVPARGEINIYGEFWPVDLADANDSGDITTAEIPEALIFFGAAEYLDMLGEADKANYWRQKALVVVDNYGKQLSKQDFDAYDVWKRRPFGRASRGKREIKVNYGGITLDDLDMGEWT